ncbi:MAG TPA: hypothetical protein VND99_01870 [Candidatus Acidoferrales bacterium]|nr:hypothetical protein [Candidatus Acidoferrales bacterium]
MNKKATFTVMFFMAAISFLALFPASTHASGGCLPLLNGGVTNKQYCQSPTPMPSANSGSQTTLGQNTIQQTGTQKVYPAAKSKSTPNTGPETWYLFAFVIAGGAGLLLRNKANT